MCRPAKLAWLGVKAFGLYITTAMSNFYQIGNNLANHAHLANPSYLKMTADSSSFAIEIQTDRSRSVCRAYGIFRSICLRITVSPKIFFDICKPAALKRFVPEAYASLGKAKLPLVIRAILIEEDSNGGPGGTRTPDLSQFGSPCQGSILPS